MTEMIAKIVPIKSLCKSNFSTLIKYLSNSQDKSERIGQISVTNCYTDDLKAALIEIQNTQSMNTRARSDKTCHLVLSLSEGERLTHAELNIIEDKFCHALGFTGHQRISVIHDDTDYLHMHIAINKIHPTKLTIHNPYYDYKIVAKVCEQIEQEYGLAIVNHETVKDHASRVAHDIEAKTGVESLVGWIKREVLSEIKQASNWQDLHQILAGHGLEIRERGNGLVFAANNGMVVKASTIDRSFSKAKLTQKLGAFVQDKYIQTPQQNTKRYHPRPLQNRVDTSKLYARYQQEQNGSAKLRAKQWNMLRESRDLLIDRAKHEAKLKRNLIRNIKAGKLARKALFAAAHQQFKTTIQVIKDDYRNAYQESKAHHSRRTWLDWLTFEAKQGNAEALAILRSRRDGQHSHNHVSGQQSKLFSGEAIHSKSVSITKNGTAMYKAKATSIRDKGNRLIVLPDTSTDALGDILVVAMKKYGKHLSINGTEQFRHAIAKAAVQNHVHVTFDDAQLERYRQQLAKQSMGFETSLKQHKRSASAIKRSL